MCRHNDCRTALLGEAMQELCDGEPIGCIKVARWLVSEDKLGMTDEGTGYGDTLLLATRELVGIFVALGLKPHILESLVDAALALAAAAAVLAGQQADEGGRGYLKI